MRQGTISSSHDVVVWNDSISNCSKSSAILWAFNKNTDLSSIKWTALRLRATVNGGKLNEMIGSLNSLRYLVSKYCVWKSRIWKFASESAKQVEMLSIFGAPMRKRDILSIRDAFSWTLRAAGPRPVNLQLFLVNLRRWRKRGLRLGGTGGAVGQVKNAKICAVVSI